MTDDRKFTAFISYRHLPLDIKVAEKLQNLIEHYRVPRALQSEHGKSMGLVFRDRTELPLSNNLSQDIYHALDNSEFLIVICSRETPNSLWVDREIEHFISTHGRDRVLTVLIDGTPEESIPDRITTVRSPDSNTVLEQFEPLCAYLVAENEKTVLKNLKTEFLRLIAAMLNTPYDSLYQRQKRYRRQLFTAAGVSVAAVIATIFFLLIRWNLDVTEKNEEISNMNQQIKNQLYQTQLKESESLTLLSEVYLSRNNRPAAVKAAVQALPSESDPRPYYSAAEAALANALQPYSSAPYQIDYVINHSAQVDCIRMSPDGKHLATVDTFGTLRCFDLSKKQEIWTYAAYSEPNVLQYYFFYDFIFTDTELHFFTNSTVYSLSLASGELLSSHEYLYTMLEIAPDHSGYAWTETDTSNSSQSLTIYYRNLKKNQIYSTTINDFPYNKFFYRSSISVDGSSYLLLTSDSPDSFDDPQLYAYLYNTSKNTVRKVWQTDYNDDCQAVVTALPDQTFLVSRLSSPTRLSIFKISASGLILAQNEIICPEGLKLSSMSTRCSDGLFTAFIPIADQTWALWLDAGNCDVLDQYTDDTATFCWFRLQSDSSLALYFAYTNTYRVQDQFTKEIVEFQPAINVGTDSWSNDANVFSIAELAPDGSYGNVVYTFCKTNIDADAEPISLSSVRLISPSGKLVLGFSETGDMIILNTETGEIHTLTDTEGKKITEAVFSGDESRLIFADGSAYDLLSGKMLHPEGWINPETPGLICVAMRPLDAAAGKPAYSVSYQNDTLRWSQDGADFQTTANPYAVALESGQKLHIQVGQNGLVVLRLYQRFSLMEILELGRWDSIAPYAVYDTHSDQWKQFPELSPEGNFANVCIAKEQKWILHSDHLGMTRLYDFETNTYLWEKMHWFDSTSMTAVFLKNDSFIMVSDSNGISILDATTGEIVSTFFDANINDYFMQALENPANNRLYLSTWDTTDPATYGVVIDMDAWIPIHSVPRMSGYLPCRNSLLLEKNDGSDQLILRPMYSLNELLTLANQLLYPEPKPSP